MQPEDEQKRRSEQAQDAAAKADRDENAGDSSAKLRPNLDTKPVSDEGLCMPISSDPSKVKTDYLNVPEGTSGSMVNRPPSTNTTRLTSAWKLRWKIGEETYVMPATERIVIGRAMEGDTGIGFDLTPYGAYHFGVSRMHAVLTLHDGYLYLEDLNSTNGTRINGFQVTPKQRYRLRDGDEIEFGRLRTVLRFETPGSK